MSRRSIHIDRLTVCMKGVSPETGRRVAEGLGEAVLLALKERLQQARIAPNAHVAEIDAGADASAVPRSPQQLQSAIADGTARSVGARLQRREGK